LAVKRLEAALFDDDDDDDDDEGFVSGCCVVSYPVSTRTPMACKRLAICTCFLDSTKRTITHRSPFPIPIPACMIPPA